MGPSHVPERRCLGCGRRAPKRELARFVARPGEGGAVLLRDDRGRLGGRGLYVCRAPACFDQAVRRRAFGRGARLRGVPLAIAASLRDGLAG